MKMNYSMTKKYRDVRLKVERPSKWQRILPIRKTDPHYVTK